MTAVRVQNKLGQRFTVKGKWLFDGDKPPEDRVTGGYVTVSVNAYSAEDAIRQVEKMLTADIIVDTVEMQR